MASKYQEEARFAFQISTVVATLFVLGLLAVIAWAEGGAA